MLSRRFVFLRNWFLRLRLIDQPLDGLGDLRMPLSRFSSSDFHRDGKKLLIVPLNVTFQQRDHLSGIRQYVRLTPHGSAHWPAARRFTVHAKKFVASLSQIPPIMPVLPTQPTRKCCAVYNLPEDSFHGMEEVIGRPESPYL